MAYSAHAQRLPEYSGHGPGFLTRDDLLTVIDLLAELAPGWSADLNQASPDESTIVITPAGANDLIGPAFVLHCGQGRFHLDQFRWDEYRKLGAFGSLDDALAGLRARLLPLAAARLPEPDRAD
jgi:hypothetical protein